MSYGGVLSPYTMFEGHHCVLYCIFNVVLSFLATITHRVFIATWWVMRLRNLCWNELNIKYNDVNVIYLLDEPGTLKKHLFCTCRTLQPPIWYDNRTYGSLIIKSLKYLIIPFLRKPKSEKGQCSDATIISSGLSCAGIALLFQLKERNLMNYWYHWEHFL